MNPWPHGRSTTVATDIALAGKFRSEKGLLFLRELAQKYGVKKAAAARICRDYEIQYRARGETRINGAVRTSVSRPSMEAAQATLAREIALARAEAATAPPFKDGPL